MEVPHRLPDWSPEPPDTEEGMTTGLYPEAEANRFCCPSPDPRLDVRPDPKPEPKPEVRPEVRPDVRPESEERDPKPDPEPDERPERPNPGKLDGGGRSE